MLVSNREIEYDFLRIAACFFVIVLHTSAHYVNLMDRVPASFFTLSDWQVGNLYETVSRCSVPLFVMISGAFMLDNSRELARKKIFVKAKKIVVLYFFWAVIYFVFTQVGKMLTGGVVELQQFFEYFFYGSYHMWYLCLIFSMYLLTPLLRVIVSDRRNEQYFLVLSFIVTFIVPLIKLVPYQPLIAYVDKFDVSLVTGYTFYYVAGHYMRQYYGNRKIKKRNATCAICLLIFCFILVAWGTWALNLGCEERNGLLYGNLFITTMVESMMVFYLTIYFGQRMQSRNIAINRRIYQMVTSISNLTMGIYLIHVLGLEGMQIVLDYYSWPVSSIIIIPAVSIICFILCVLICKLMKKNKATDFLIKI